MTIRKKIVLYFSSILLVLVGITFVFIYMLFAEYREEEFQQRQKEKIVTTLKFLNDVEEMNESIAQAMDKITIHDFYDEKLLIYNQNKELIHASIDDLPIAISNNILNKLSKQTEWIETKEGSYDVIGVYVESRNGVFYGISKAYDEFGFTKLRFLGWLLVLIYIGIALVVFLIANYISQKIAKPITDITRKIQNYDFDKETEPLNLEGVDEDEIKTLALRFNELMQRTRESFVFQKHAIQHISHELKTPISVLVSNLEKLEESSDLTEIKEGLYRQKVGTKSLADIINTLLEISKIEARPKIVKDDVRIDEVVFDVINELEAIYPDFFFKIDFNIENPSEKELRVKGNKQLLRSAFMNLLLNSIVYNSENYTDIIFTISPETLSVKITNSGAILNKKEQSYLFDHYFRGVNSKGKSGFGLGLVLVQKIVTIHEGKIEYSSLDNKNIFEIEFSTS